MIEAIRVRVVDRLRSSALRRWLEAMVDLRRAAGLRHLPRFLRDFYRFRRMGGKAAWVDTYPCLTDRTAVTPFDPHYFYQGAWLARHLAVHRPSNHIDVASQVTVISVISAFVSTTFIDFRPLQAELTGLTNLRGDLMCLELPSDSVESLSSLHVIEHVGLGRYGDALDPEGTRKAAAELGRVLRPGGRLYISVPVGRERVCFHAHRVLAPACVPEMFTGLTLEEFAYVDDDGCFHQRAKLEDASGYEYGCGMFVFRKPDR